MNPLTPRRSRGFSSCFLSSFENIGRWLGRLFPERAPADAEKQFGLTCSDVGNVGNPAQLGVDEADVDSYAKDFSLILNSIKEINAVDTAGIQPMVKPVDMAQRLRSDGLTESSQRNLSQSVDTPIEDGLYLVPRGVE